MNLQDLNSVADVCVRFRQNSLHSPRLKDYKRVKLNEKSTVSDYSKLRNFGAFIESVTVSGKGSEETPTKQQKHDIELLSRYCTGTSIRLAVCNLNLSDEIALLMVPLLTRARKLSFFQTRLGKLSLKKLAFWSPELRELHFTDEDEEERGEEQFTCLRGKFPKLESLSFEDIRYSVDQSDIEEFLKLNSQLKKLDILCCRSIDDSIYRTIAKCVPGFEKVNFCTKRGVSQSTAKYFGQMHELKSLSLSVYSDEPYMQAIIHQIGSANIALEHLYLDFFDMNYKSAQFVKRMAKLRQLKKLQFGFVKNMEASHLIQICMHMKELSKIELIEIDIQMTATDLLNIIRNAEKLQLFQIGHMCGNQNPRTNIDAGTFKQLVEIVERRREKTPLTMFLSPRLFTFNIPVELKKAATNSVKLNDWLD